MNSGKATTKSIWALVIFTLLVSCANPQRASPVLASALHRAILNDNEKKALHLIGKQKGLDEFYKSGETPLGMAIKRDQAVIVTALLEAGANPSLLNSVGHSPLAIAVQSRKRKYVQELLEYSPRINTGPESAIYFASRQGLEDYVIELLPRVESFESRWFRDDKEKYTALHYAAMMRDTKLIQLALDSGADVNAVSDSERSALMLVVRDPDAWSNLVYRNMPKLDRATELAVRESILLLLEAGADIALRDYGGKDVFRIAEESRNQSRAIELLLAETEYREISVQQVLQAYENIAAQIHPYELESVYRAATSFSMKLQPAGENGITYSYTTKQVQGYRYYVENQLGWEAWVDMITRAQNRRGYPIAVKTYPVHDRAVISEFSGSISAAGAKGTYITIADLGAARKTSVGSPNPIAKEEGILFGDITEYRNGKIFASYRYLAGAWYFKR